MKNRSLAKIHILFMILDCSKDKSINSTLSSNILMDGQIIIFILNFFYKILCLILIEDRA
jgi:hypothetical protein